jgi:hypothetical protein
MMARLCQKFLRLSVPPEKRGEFRGVDETMSPARLPDAGIQISALNSVLPAAVKGWGLEGSIR